MWYYLPNENSSDMANNHTWVRKFAQEWSIAQMKHEYRK